MRRDRRTTISSQQQVRVSADITAPPPIPTRNAQRRMNNLPNDTTATIEMTGPVGEGTTVVGAVAVTIETTHHLEAPPAVHGDSEMGRGKAKGPTRALTGIRGTTKETLISAEGSTATDSRNKALSPIRVGLAKTRDKGTKDLIREGLTIARGLSSIKDL